MQPVHQAAGTRPLPPRRRHLEGLVPGAGPGRSGRRHGARGLRVADRGGGEIQVSLNRKKFDDFNDEH